MAGDAVISESRPAGRAWLIFGTAGLFVFFQLVLQSLPSVIREGLVVDFSLNDAGFGGLSSSFYYPYMLLQIPAGFLVERFGSRRMLTIGIILCIAACVLMAFSRELLHVGLARILMGLGAAPTFVATMALILRWFPTTYFPILVALTEMLGMLGAALGQEILGFVVDTQGWRMGMAHCALFGTTVMALIILFVRNGPAGATEKPRSAGRGAILKAILQPRVLLASLAGGMIYSAGLAFAMLWGVSFFQGELEISLQKASLCASFYSWGIIAGLPILGWACGRYIRPVPLMMLGAIFTGIAVAVILYGPENLLTASLGMLMCGFFSASYATTFPVVAAEVRKEHSGTALGLANMIIIAVGGLFLQPLIGMLAQSHGEEAPQANALVVLVWAQAAAVILLAVFLGMSRKAGDSETHPPSQA